MVPEKAVQPIESLPFKPPTKWFRTGLDPGTNITFDHPGISRWKVIERLNEHDHQLPEEEVRNTDYPAPPCSYASIRLLCQNAERPSKKAFVRIYSQVPWTNSEMDDPQIRAKQAMKKFTPIELIAYQALLEADAPNTPRLTGWKATTQGKNDLVPGGFTVSLVWEKVPGLQLGNHNVAGLFWTLDPYEQKLIRDAVIVGLRNLIAKTGCAPTYMGPSALVWDRSEKKIYFVGFRESEVDINRRNLIDTRCLSWFGLDKELSTSKS